MKYGIIIFIGSLSSLGYTQSRERNIIGDWKTCYVIGSKKAPDCDSSNLYKFKMDYNYVHTQNRTKKYVTEGVWNCTNKKLKIDPNDDENSTYYPYSVKIKWIDNNTFYTVGREGFLGPKVYHYYFRLI